MLTAEIVRAIEDALRRGFEVEIFLKPDGTLNIKTVKRKKLFV